MKDKTYKDIMVGYSDNPTRDTCKLYNTDTNRVIVTRDIKWAEWKLTDPAETMNMFRDSHEECLVPDIYEDKTPTSEPEDKLHVHTIPDEG